MMILARAPERGSILAELDIDPSEGLSENGLVAFFQPVTSIVSSSAPRADEPGGRRTTAAANSHRILLTRIFVSTLARGSDAVLVNRRYHRHRQMSKKSSALCDAGPSPEIEPLVRYRKIFNKFLSGNCRVGGHQLMAIELIVCMNDVK
jgi:hypothetical protein